MESIYKDDKERKIDKTYDMPLTVKSDGIYSIRVVAKTKDEKQLGGTDDEDLRIEIDTRKFPQFNNPEKYSDSPASFSGGTLKGLKKTVYFILRLNAGKHTISFIPDISATFLGIEIFKVSEGSNITELNLPINDEAEDGDRRPWITVVLVDFALDKFSIEALLKRRFIDSDDVKVIVDDNVKRNDRSRLHKYWYFIASFFVGEVQKETFTANLSYKIHFLEFWADRKPTLEQIKLEGLRLISVEEIKEKIRSEAEKVGLDTQLMISVATWESHFDPRVFSLAGAKGIFQLTSITIKDIEQRFGFKIDDPFDVDQNIKGAMFYFKWLMERYSGDPELVEKTLVAWNWGLNNFPKDPPLDWSKIPEATKAFVKNVLNRW